MKKRDCIETAALAGVATTLTGSGASQPQTAERTVDAKTIRSHNPDMRYRTFGKTGEKVSVLGFGGMRWPVVGNDSTKIDLDAAMKLVRTGVEGGINYVDSSWSYHSISPMEGGDSEIFTGKLAREVGRDRIYIATKLPIWAVTSRADMDTFLDAQLKRLDTDHIDFYLVHNVRKTMWDDMVRFGLQDFLDKALQSGKIRHAGFSFHDTPETYREVMEYYDWSFNQMVCNYHDSNFQAGMRGIRQAALRDMGFVAMEAVMGGILADQLPKEALDVFAATGIDRSPAGWALRWVWNQPEVSVIVSGLNKMDHLQENLRLAKESDIPFTPAESDAVDNVRAILKGMGGIACSECGRCSCPKGVDIQTNFELYNADVAFKVPHLGHLNYGMGFKQSLRAAENCDGCGHCNGQCPQGLNIPPELARVAAHFKDADILWLPPDHPGPRG